MEDKVSQTRAKNLLWILWVLILLALLFWLTSFAYADATLYPEKPKKGYIIDDSERFEKQLMFSTLQGLSLRLAYENNIEIHTLIIESIEQMNRYFLEDYAKDLFNTWQLGEEGMLLVVDVQNQAASIALGPGRDNDDKAKVAELLDNVIIPGLEKGDVLGSVQYGIKGLEAMSLGDDMPKRLSWWQHPFFLKTVLPVLILGVILNLIFRYRHSKFWVILPYLGAFFFIVEWTMENGKLRGGSGGFGCGGCTGCSGCAGCGGGCGGCGGA